MKIFDNHPVLFGLVTIFCAVLGFVLTVGFSHI